MTAKHEWHECSGKTWSDIGHNRIYQCSRSATVERNGKWYCWQHDPERIKAEAEKHRAAWQAKGDREAAKYARIARNARLGALVTEETAGLLERLAQYANLYDAPESAYNARELATKIREALDNEK